MKLKKRESGIYYIDYTPKGGKRTRFSTGTKVRREAQEMFDKFKHESWRQDRLDEKPIRKHLWEEAVVRYLNDKKNIKSIEFIKGEINNLTPFLNNVFIQDIDEDLINHIRDSRLADTFQRCEGGKKFEISTRTANITVGQLRTILKRARDQWGWLNNIPKFTFVESRSDISTSYCWLTHEEAKSVLKELPNHLQDMMKFSIATGLRKSNVTGLTWKKVDLVKKTAYVDAVESKNKRPLLIPLNDDAIEILLSLQGNHETYVFTYKGKPIKDSNTAAWRKALDRTGIRPYFPPPSARESIKNKYPTRKIDTYKYLDFRWHDLRHTWASWHVQAGTQLKVLQELGGWRSYDMVLRYAHLGDSHVASYANHISINKK